MNKKLIRCALLGAVALLAAACFGKHDFRNEYDAHLGKHDFRNEYDAHLLVKFEPDYDYEWDEFLNKLFDGGKDTIACAPSISLGPIYHFAKLDDADDFLGGICLARGKDADASAGRKPSRFAVFDADGGPSRSWFPMRRPPALWSTRSSTMCRPPCRPPCTATVLRKALSRPVTTSS